jgi:hypothetical protein
VAASQLHAFSTYPHTVCGYSQSVVQAVHTAATGQQPGCYLLSALVCTVWVSEAAATRAVILLFTLPRGGIALELPARLAAARALAVRSVVAAARIVLHTLAHGARAFILRKRGPGASAC